MERKPLLVNFFGGAGAGKSTTSAGVFSLLKLHDIECELVPEYAKDLVWEERHKTFKNDPYIFAKQYHRIWRVTDKVDIIITDCPLLLSAIYGKKYKTVNDEFVSYVIKTIESFNNLNVLLRRVKKYKENGRNEKEEEARDVDILVENTLSAYGMDFITTTGDYNGINEIVRLLLGDKFKMEICRIY